MIAAVIVMLLLAVLFTFSGSIKLLGVRQSLVIRDHLGVTSAQWRMIGLLELAGVVGVLVGLAWPRSVWPPRSAWLCCRLEPSAITYAPPTG
jgi:hypothetical protein